MKLARVIDITRKLSAPGKGMMWNGRVAEGRCGNCKRKVFKDVMYGWSHDNFNTSCGSRLEEAA